MAVVQRIKIHPNQLLELEDVKKIDEFVCADLFQIMKNFIGSENQSVKGGRVFQNAELTDPNIGTSPVYIELADSVFYKVLTRVDQYSLLEPQALLLHV